MARKKKKIKSNLELLMEIRREWVINPVTRVQENEKKNNKKLRQFSKKLCQE